MPKPKKLILALLLSPLVAPILFGISEAVLVGMSSSFTQFAADVALLSMYVLPVTYIALLLFGIPTVMALEKLRLLTLPWLATIATIQGFVVMYLFIAGLSRAFWNPISTANFWHSDLVLLFRGSFMAVGVAITFWYIGGITRRSTRTRATTARAG